MFLTKRQLRLKAMELAIQNKSTGYEATYLVSDSEIILQFLLGKESQKQQTSTHDKE